MLPGPAAAGSRRRCRKKQPAPGRRDHRDACPDDPADWRDSDRDGVCDAADWRPTDPAEWQDSDGDGVGEYADAFPLDPSQAYDNDGVARRPAASCWSSSRSGRTGRASVKLDRHGEARVGLKIPYHLHLSNLGPRQGFSGAYVWRLRHPKPVELAPPAG